MPRFQTRTLVYIIVGLSILIAIMALGGCAAPNPSWGGSRW